MLEYITLYRSIVHWSHALLDMVLKKIPETHLWKRKKDPNSVVSLEEPLEVLDTTECFPIRKLLIEEA